MPDLTEDEIKTRIAMKVKKLYAQKKKKYICEFCGTGFDKRDFLISHMKIRHPDDYDLKYGESNYAKLAPSIRPAPATPATPVRQPAPVAAQPRASPVQAPVQPVAPVRQPISPSAPMSPAANTISPAASMRAPQVTFSAQTIAPATMDQINDKLDQINDSFKSTMKILGLNMDSLNKELRYLICEYKSPFIIFD